MLNPKVGSVPRKNRQVFMDYKSRPSLICVIENRVYTSINRRFSTFIILIVFISFTKQFFTFHSNRIKCEKQILPSVGFEPTTSCIRGKRLTARPRGKICFSHFILLEWSVKNCFVKLIKTIKLTEKNYFV